MLGVGSSASEMAQLMEVAAVRGRAMGLSATQAFNDIVTGIGRGSRMILDNLGIILDLDQVYGDYAATLGITAKALTEAQKKEAMTQAVIKDTQGLLRETGGLLVDAAGQWEKLDAAEANWAAASKRRLLKAGTAWAKFWSGQIEDSTRMIELQQSLNTAIEAGIIPVGSLNKEHTVLGLTLAEMEELYKNIAPELDDYIIRQENIAKALELADARGQDYADELRVQIPIIDELGEALARARGGYVDTATAIGMAETALRDQNVELEGNIWLQDQLALMNGEITPAQIALRGVIEDLTAALADHLITEYEYIASLKILQSAAEEGGAAVLTLSAALNNMPHEIRTKILLDYGYETVPGTGYLPGPQGPPKALGGPVIAGTSYMVGERGPELFVPNSSGNIVPNGATSGGFGNVTVEEGAIQIFTQGEGIDAYELLDTLAEEIGRR